MSSKGRRAYLVGFLALILTVYGFDSIALGLAMPNIKAALRLTDTEIGFLTGFAFTLFYSTVGIPIGRWADRGNRIAIIALTMGIWSIMTMLVGGARSFSQLLLIRVGAAIGESGCLPASYSLLADEFSRDERPRAVGKFLLGSPLSLMLGFALAGLLSRWYGWRTMFVILGLPGMVVAAAAWWTLIEPRNTLRRPDPGTTDSAQVPRLAEVGAILWRNKTYCRMLFGTCILFFFASGIGAWQPSFYVRSYGLQPEKLGLLLAVTYGVFGFAGTYCGGYLASRFAGNDESRQLKALAALYAFSFLAMVLVYLTDGPYVSLAFLGLVNFAGGLGGASVNSVQLIVVPERMRAISISVVALFSNLIGSGLGPLTVGALSDMLHGVLGKESLRYALLAMCPGWLWASWQMWRAAQLVSLDMGNALSRREG